MNASPENLIAIALMALAALVAKGGGFIAMRWLGRHRFVSAWLQHAPGAVLVSAAIVPLTQGGGAYLAGAVVGAAATRTAGGFSLDTTTLSDGWHDVRVVAYNADAVRTQNEKQFGMTVNNLGQSLILIGTNTVISSLKINIV